jgi:hypothetical protein
LFVGIFEIISNKLFLTAICKLMVRLERFERSTNRLEPNAAARHSAKPSVFYFRALGF